jgi:hypothetical protein
MAFDHAGTLEAVDDVLLVGQKQAIDEACDGYAILIDVCGEALALSTHSLLETIHGLVQETNIVKTMKKCVLTSR